MAIAHTNRLAPQPNGNGSVPQKSLQSRIEALASEFAKALPGGVGNNAMKPDRLCRLALTACRLNPKLGECNFTSLAGSLMTAAQLGLEPNTPLGHCYLIPRRNGKTGLQEVTFQLGYQGMIELSQRSGRIQNLYAAPVYSHDEFDYWLGLEPNVIHRPANGNRGALVAVYAVAKYKDGGSNFEVLTIDEIESYRRRSLSANNGPWNSDYVAMALKTAVRRLFKWLPKSTELAIAVTADDSIRKWDAVNGDVLQEYNQVESVEIATPQVAYEDEITEVEVETQSEPERPAEVVPEQPKAARTRKAQGPKNAVETTAKQVETPPENQAEIKPDPPFETAPSNGPATQQTMPFGSAPAEVTKMQSLTPPNPRAAIIKKIDSWLYKAADKFADDGHPEFAKRAVICQLLYDRFVSEGRVREGEINEHKQVAALADLGTEWEAVHEILRATITALDKEFYGEPAN